MVRRGPGVVARAERRAALFFVAPWIIGFFVFEVYPLSMAAYYSFCDYSVLRAPVWIGTMNYAGLMSDDVFWKSLANTAIYAGLAIPFGMVVAISLALLLNSISFPIYMKASLLGTFGVRGSFGITPKGQSASMPLSNFWPQLTLATVAFAGVIWGALRLYYEREPFGAIAVSMFWCAYHVAILGMTLYFNFPEEQPAGSGVRA